MRNYFKAIIAVTVAFIIAAALAVGLSTGQASALGKIKCVPVVGYAQVDPIVAHGAPKSAHLHTFLGNTEILKLSSPQDATYQDLVNKGTTCENPDDTAAYWIPTLVYTSGPQSGQPVPISSYDAYYRSYNHEKYGEASAYAPDTRLVAGDSKAMESQSLKVANWTCDQNSSRPGPYHNIIEAACNKATGKVRLTMHITFPSCWDGQLSDHTVNGNTSDNSHYAYYLNSGKGDSCPDGFPIKTPELRETVWWDYQGSGSDVALVSDLMMADMGTPVVPGTTAHADFWNTWVQTGGTFGGLVGLVHDCINTKVGSAAECG
jgi:hypothetical protein